MKKSQTIQLVLITAALASCKAIVIPERSEPLAEWVPDSTLTTTPADSLSDCEPCREISESEVNYAWYPYDFYYDPLESYIFNFNFSVKKGHVWRSTASVVRGGFGKSGFGVAS